MEEYILSENNTGHVHKVFIDVYGNGHSSVNAGHSHEVINYDVQRAGGHDHQLAQVKSGIEGFGTLQISKREKKTLLLAAILGLGLVMLRNARRVV